MAQVGRIGLVDFVCYMPVLAVDVRALVMDSSAIIHGMLIN